MTCKAAYNDFLETELELFRGARLLGEATARPGDQAPAAASGDWLTVAGLEVNCAFSAGSLVLTVLMPAAPCQGLHALWPEGELHPRLVLREPGHPAEVTLWRGTAECCCKGFRRRGDCGHIRAVSTIIGFADDKETQ